MIIRLPQSSGSGVNAILAASTATDVLAIDINPHAVAAARHNGELNGVADRIQVRHSDVFSDVDGTFDLIIPVDTGPARTAAHPAAVDHGYHELPPGRAGAGQRSSEIADVAQGGGLLTRKIVHDMAWDDLPRSARDRLTASGEDAVRYQGGQRGQPGFPLPHATTYGVRHGPC
jgi:hypothetical protein